MAAETNHYVNNQLPQPVSADLTNITLSGSPTNFIFSGTTYTYNNVTVANNVTGITVTPTGAGTITVDETAVASGNTSSEIALTPGVERTIPVRTTETGKVTKTYTIRVTRLGTQAAPTFIPAEGPVTFGSELQIISSDADHIYYTTDGSEPGTSVGGATLEYNDSAKPIIDRAMTVRAVAVKAGWGNSTYSSAVYTQASPATFTITASAGAGGSISPSGAISITEGGNQTFTITPNGGYRIASVTIDGENMGALSTYTFSGVEENHTIAAAFVQNEQPVPVKTSTYTVSYHPNGGTGTVPVDMNRYYKGDKISLLSGAGLTKSGYVFAGWALADGTPATNPFTMGRQSVTLYAVWTNKEDIPLPPKTGDPAMVFGAALFAPAAVIACAYLLLKGKKAKHRNI
jgi:uncharacterized repeat protein (TIGR02543 family)